MRSVSTPPRFPSANPVPTSPESLDDLHGVEHAVRRVLTMHPELGVREVAIHRCGDEIILDGVMFPDRNADLQAVWDEVREACGVRCVVNHMIRCEAKTSR